MISLSFGRVLGSSDDLRSHQTCRKTNIYWALIQLAEREGFEPSVPCGTLHFQCSAIDHSATSPLLPARRCIKGRAGGGSRVFKGGVGAGVGVGVGVVDRLTRGPVGQSEAAAWGGAGVCPLRENVAPSRGIPRSPLLRGMVI